MHSFIEGGRFAGGLPYDEYTRAIETRLQQPPPADRLARKEHFYVKYNQSRAAAVEADFEPSRALIDAMSAIKAPQLWMVLTEDWCVDSAFAMPVFARAASLNPHVTLRVFPRDQHLDVMDQFLTNGARSIPVLVAFSEAGEELFRWGPRPAGAAAYRRQLVDEGLEKPEISARLAAWLEAGGWRGIEPELTERVLAATRSLAAGA